MTAIEYHYNLINLQGNLMRYANSLTLDKEKAKDLVQETFLKALIYQNKYRYNKNLKAWVFTIMKNTFINNYRQKWYNNTYNTGSKDDYFQGFRSPPNASDSTDSFIALKEIEKKFEVLNQSYKMPFKMYNNGFKYKEIAEKLELKLGTVKSRIFFARKILMEQLTEYID